MYRGDEQQILEHTAGGYDTMILSRFLVAFHYCFEMILLVFNVREGLLCSYRVLLTIEGMEGLNRGID